MEESRRKSHEIRMYTMLILKVTRQHIEQRFAEEGVELTMMQHAIMRMIQHEALTLTDLSKRMGLLDPSTLVPMVDSMVKKGFLKRERDPNDRRRYPLHITEAGQKLYGVACMHLEQDPINAALDNFEGEEVEQLRHLLRKLLIHLPDGEATLQEFESHYQESQ